MYVIVWECVISHAGIMWSAANLIRETWAGLAYMPG